MVKITTQSIYLFIQLGVAPVLENGHVLLYAHILRAVALWYEQKSKRSEQ